MGKGHFPLGLKRSGDWGFHILTGPSRNVREVDFQEFCRDIESLVKTTCKVDPETHRCDGHGFQNFYFDPSGFRMVLEEWKFDEMVDLVARDELDVTFNLPFFSFHATSNVTKVNGIVKDGYLLPGEQHHAEGWSLRMQNGRVYGDGIYSSTKFDTAQWYSFLDSKGSVLMILNAVIPGKVLEWKEDLDHVLNRDEGVYKEWIWRKTTKDGFWEETGRTGHSIRVNSESGIWVVGSPTRIVPVAVFKLNPTADFKAIMQRTTFQFSIDAFGLVEFEDIAHPQYCVNTYCFSKDIFLVDPFLQRIEDGEPLVMDGRATPIRTLLACPVQLLWNTSILDGLNTFQESIAGVCGDSVYSFLFNQQNADIRKQKVTALINERDKKNVQIAKLASCLDKVADWITKSNDNNNFLNIIYIFVTESMDVDENSIEKVLDKWTPYLKQKWIQMKFIFATSKEHESSSLLLKCGAIKSRIQNIEAFEQFYHSTNPETVSETCSLLEVELENVVRHFESFVEWKIPYPLGIVGEGFIRAPQEIECPVWDVKHSAVSNFLLFKGAPPKFLLRDGKLYRVKFVEHLVNIHQGFVEYSVRYAHGYIRTGLPASRLTSAENEEGTCENPKNVSKSFFVGEKVRDETGKIGVVIGKNSRSAGDVMPMIVETILPLLASFRNHAFRYPERVKRYRDLVQDFGETLGIKLAEFEAKSCQNVAYSVLRSAQHGLQKVMSDIQAFGNVQFSGKFFQSLRRKKFAKSILRRTAKHNNNDDDMNFHKLVRKYLSFDQRKIVREVVDVLASCCFDRMGTLVRLNQTAASEVEPWLIRVEYVSSTKASVSMVFRAAEDEETIKDHRGARVTDILPDEGTFDDITKLYYAYAFTRIPHLYLPSQVAALLVNTWVATIEQAFLVINNAARKGKPHDHKEVERLLHQAYFEHLPRVQRLMGTKDREMRGLLPLIRGDSFHKYLTQTHGVSSITRLLGILAVVSIECDLLSSCRAGLESDPLWSKFCVALLAENTMRECKAKMRMKRRSPESLIDHVLGISTKIDPDKWILDRKRAARLTTNFFFHGYSNCSTFAVVSVLGFIECIQRNLNFDSTLKRFNDGEISMQRFLTTHLSGFKGTGVQIALFLQGMKYCKSQLRQNEEAIRFDDPRKIIGRIAEDQLKVVRVRQELEKQMLEKRNERFARRLEEAAPFKIWHQEPKLFSIREVSEMNENLGENVVKFELQPSGLLKHHCCYPDCPDYLQCFATDMDLAKGFRYGIMNHLKHDMLLGNYARGFHLVAKSIVSGNKKIDVETFTERMKTEFQTVYDFDKLKFAKDISSIWEQEQQERKTRR